MSEVCLVSIHCDSLLMYSNYIVYEVNNNIDVCPLTCLSSIVYYIMSPEALWTPKHPSAYNENNLHIPTVLPLLSFFTPLITRLTSTSHVNAKSKNDE